MFSANILKNRSKPLFKKTKPKKKKNTTNWKWPSRYPPSDTPKQLAIFVPNLLSSCISWAIYPDTKLVWVSSDLHYQPLTKPCWLHVTVRQIHHLSWGPARAVAMPLPRWARACLLHSPSSLPPLLRAAASLTPKPPHTSSFPLKSLTVDGRRALTPQMGMCF